MTAAPQTIVGVEMTKPESVIRLNKIIKQNNHIIILRDNYVVKSFELNGQCIYATIVDGDVNDEPIRRLSEEIKCYAKTEVTWQKVKGCL